METDGNFFSPAKWYQQNTTVNILFIDKLLKAFH